jgi:protein-histidine pros-kinase
MKIRILYFGANPQDSGLVQAALRDQDVDGEIQLVDGEESYVTALDQGGFDLILADHSLVSCDGLSALRIRKEKCPETPFILFSGALGEEAVIEFLKLGATDYVLKQHLTRLAPCIKRALQEAEDLRARKLAQTQLHLQSAALTAAANAIVITDRQGRIVWVNPAFSRLTGYSSQEAVGQNPRLLKSGNHDQRVYYDLWKTILSGHVWSGEIVNRRKDGSLYTEEQSITPVKNDDGKISHFIAIKQDITERKQVEQALHARDVAEAANRTKSEFLANMSHELRTPLNAIIGFTGTLLMKLPGPLTKDQDNQLKTIQSSARHLLSLINDLLDLARIESGKVDVNFEPVVCQRVIEEIITAIQPLARNKGLELDVQMPTKDLTVMTDRRALSQIIINLANNAIKFTEKGSIHLEVGQRQENGRIQTQISVIDTGTGIRGEDQAKLFKAFTQVNGDNSQRHEGTGLGLHLSQKLATLLGGHITLESEFGKGSTFRLVIEEK